MSWIFFALLTSFVSAVSNIIDKTVLSKWMRRSVGSMLPFAAIEAAVGLASLAWLGFPLMPAKALAAALASGAASAAMALFYFRAVKAGEVSTVVPIQDLSSLFVMLFAAVFLSETLTWPNYLGVLLLVGGAVLISNSHLNRFSFGKGVGWMLLGTVSISAAAVGLKYAVGLAPSGAVFAWSRLGTLFVTVPAMGRAWPAFASAFRSHGWRMVAATGASEVLTVASGLFYVLATSTGQVTLVNALVGTYPFFVLAISVTLTLFFPRILKERLDGGRLARKILAIVLMFAGAMLVT